MYDKLFNDLEAFLLFFRKNDSQENRDAILKTSRLCFLYCKFIEDREELWKNITESTYAKSYCLEISNRPEVRKHITSSFDALYYCQKLGPDTMVKQHITNAFDAYLYCTQIDDEDPAMAKIALRFIKRIKEPYGLLKQKEIANV